MNARLLSFEARYQLRQLPFWGSAAIFVVLGAAFSRFTLGGEGVQLDAPYSVALDLGLLSLLSVFVVTVLVAGTALRDRETGMEELVRASPLGRRRLALHRLGGLFAANLLILGLASLALLLGTHLAGEAATSGALRPGRYAAAFALMVVPNTLLLVVVQYLVATLSRKALAVYLSGVGIYIGYFALSVAGGSPLVAGSTAVGADELFAAGLLDPFGLVALLAETRLWTVEQMNTLAVGFDGLLLHNRLLWLGVAAGLSGLTLRLQEADGLLARWVRRLRGAAGRVGRPGGRADGAAGDSDTADGGDTDVAAAGRGGAGTQGPDPVGTGGHRTVPQDPSGWRHALASAVSGAKVQLSTRVRSVSFLLVAILWVALVVTGLREAVGDGTAFFDTPFQPLTELIVPAISSPTPFALVGSLIVVFFASELTWGDRTAGMHHLVDASPVRDATRFASTVLSLAALSLVLVTLAVAPAVGYQLLAGGEPDLLLYASLYYLLGVPWLLVGVLTVGLQHLSPGKHVGMLVAAFAVVLGRPVSTGLLDLNLPLLHVGRLPELDYSVFSGFGPFLGAVHGYLLVWGLLCVLVGAVTVAIRRRGAGDGLRARLGRLLEGRRGLSLRILGVGTIALLATGFAVQVAIVDQGFLVSEGQEELWRAEYERRYAPLSRLPRPSVEAVELSFDLYPDDRRYEVRGSYRVVNETGAPVDSIFVGWDRWITNRRITVEGAGEAEEQRPFNHVLFVMDPPLRPGDSTRVDFETSVEQTAFGEFDPAHSVVADGTFVRLERFLPWLGYDPALELDAPELRREHGLPAASTSRRAPPGATRHDARARYTLTASTAEGQRIAAPGELVRTWKTGGRRHFRFASHGPMRMRYGIASAAWEDETVATEETPEGAAVPAPGATDDVADDAASDGPAAAPARATDVTAVHLLHHPRHAVNLPRLRDASRTSIGVLSELYGPPARPSVTIAEIPSYGAEGVQATSYPGVVFVREHAGFTGDFEGLGAGEVDYFYRRVAHELAHQWWGGRLSPARAAPGAAVLTETLAEYSAALVLKWRFGEEVFRSLMRWEEEQFLRFRGRIGGEEPPLSEVTGGTDYVAYFKGPVVLNAVAELIGEEALADVLGEFMARHGSAPAVAGAGDGAVGGPGTGRAAPGAPTVEDLFRRLRDAVPESRHGLLAEWIHGTATYDLEIEGASAKRTEDGRYEIAAEVVMGKRLPGDDGSVGVRVPESEPVRLEIRREAGSATGKGGPEAAGPDGGPGAAPPVVETRTLELRPGRQTVRLVVGSRPSRLELDPNVTRIDTNRENNVRVPGDE